MGKEKVLLGMSGGVDSSVAALLLNRRGYEVYGFFMNACPSGKTSWPSSIKWKEEEKIVKKICKLVGVEKLFVVDCEEGYEKKVISKMFKDYEKGLTPNPDILCNNVGKFPGLLKKAREIGADWIATGHYARVRRKKVPPVRLKIIHKSRPVLRGGGGFEVELLRGKDKKKDQSYFLVGLGQDVLEKCLFPVGGLTKEEVRKIARQNKFPNWDKRGSRGICYLGKIDVKKFLRERIKEKKGNVVSPRGEVIGTHPGTWFFTIGERVGDRKGFEILDKYRREIRNTRLFVAGKRRGNVLVVAPEGDEILKTKKVFVKNMKFVNSEEKGRMKARIRHLGELHGGVLRKSSAGRWTFVFDKGVEGVAEGQFIVLYFGERVVGGGEIRL
ncbi:MAG: tRNA 2-thiouridine(34) synthase MnmA [Nanoarchaeota archaeon]|nr:tRNA 2-thiouridine(34) synthase MnmA [Nanoarchaeota archaeon]MBU1102960.1 tRNA 2-thiouridine(34) synthase MnmA [Nanoarchaeota archaeon]